MSDVRPAGPFALWEWVLAFRYLKGRRKSSGVGLISIIAFSAIAVAIAVLIIVMSVMNGFRAELLSTILKFNDHAYVYGAPLKEASRDAAVARIRKAPGVTDAFPSVEAQALIMGGGLTKGVNVRGVSPADLRNTTVIVKGIKQGSIDGFGQGELGGDIVLLGERLAAEMAVRPGDSIYLMSPNANVTPFGSAPVGKDFIVGGVFSVNMSTFDQIYVYMPLAQAQAFFGRGGDVDAIKVNVEDPDHMDRYIDGIRAAAGPGATVSDWRDADAAYWGALQVERNMMRMIMMLIIAIAALNIISALVMLVKNKERDIAVLRTIGAGQGAIMRVFLLSGAALGVVAAPVGVMLGVLFCVYIKPIQKFIEWITSTQVFQPDIYFLSSLPAKLDWHEVWLVFFWTLGCSIVVTLYPSWRASRIDPVEALRYE